MRIISFLLIKCRCALSYQRSPEIRFTALFTVLMNLKRQGWYLQYKHEFLYWINILFLSENLYPKAKIIFRCVSILHGIPFTIRVMVMVETFACLASSVLLSIRDSWIFLRLFLPILMNLLGEHNACIMLRPLKNTRFCPISGSDSNLIPLNIQYTLVVNIFAFFDLE